jgi:hypothetical protein
MILIRQIKHAFGFYSFAGVKRFGEIDPPKFAAG